MAAISKFVRTNRFVTPLLVVLLFAFPLIVSYDAFVTRRQEFLVRHSRRVLEMAGEHLRSRIHSASLLLGAAGQKDYGIEWLQRYSRQVMPEARVRAASETKGHEHADVTVRSEGGQLWLLVTQTGREIAMPVDGMVREFLERSEGPRFGTFLVTEASGKVLYLRSDSQLRVVDLAALMKQSGTRPPPRFGNPLEKRAEGLEFGVESRASGVSNLTIGGQRFKLFLQPMRLDDELRLNMGGQESKERDLLILAGLWTEERFSEQSRAIPANLVVWGLLLVIGVGALSWPVVKMISLAPTDRFRHRDGFMLSLSTLTATFVAALALLSLTSMLEDDQRRSRALQRLAWQIEKSFLSELSRALKTVSEFRADGRAGRTVTRQLEQPAGEGSLPWYDQIFVADEKGNQILKVAAGPDTTPRIPVVGRDYFRSVQAGWLSRLPKLSGGTDEGFALEPLLSRVTGQFMLLLATPGDEPGAVMKAILWRPISVMDPVIDPGARFAIVDRRGEVKLHSNPLLNLQIKLQDEISTPEALLEALERAEDSRFTSYHEGRLHRFVVHKLDGSFRPELYIVTWYDALEEETVYQRKILRMLLLGLAGMMAYGLICAVAGALYPHYPVEALWPVRVNNGKYVELCVGFGVLAVAYGLLLLPHAGPGLPVMIVAPAPLALLLGLSALTRTVWIGWLYPPACAAIGAFGLAVGVGVGFGVSLAAYLTIALGVWWMVLHWQPVSGRGGEAGWKEWLDRLDYRMVFPFGCAMLFTLLMLQPCAALYQLVSAEVDEENRILHRQRWAEVASAREERIRRELAWVEEAGLRAKLQQQRLGEKLDQPADAEVTPTALGDEWLRASMAGQLGSAWGAARQMLSGAGDRPVAFTAAGMTAIFLLVWVWIGFLLRRVFLLDLERPKRPEAVSMAVDEPYPTHTLVLTMPLMRLTERLEQRDDVVDLEAYPKEDWVKQLPERGTVVIHHFEFRVDEPEYTPAKLALLEEAVFRRKLRVVIVSSVDPLVYWRQGSTGAPDGLQFDRWARVLNLFTKRVFEGTPDTSFAGEVKNAPAVAEECGRTPYLRALGRELMKEDTQLDEEEVVNRLLHRADSYYQVLWSLCSRKEQLVLHQLARDGWTHFRNTEALQQLRLRGLVRMDPPFRIFNGSFRRFVLARVDRKVLEEWASESQSTWRSVQTGVRLAAVLGILWLVYAEEELIRQGLAFLTLAAAALAAVFKVVGELRTNFGGAAAGGAAKPGSGGAAD